MATEKDLRLGAAPVRSRFEAGWLERRKDVAHFPLSALFLQVCDSPSSVCACASSNRQLSQRFETRELAVHLEYCLSPCMFLPLSSQPGKLRTKDLKAAIEQQRRDRARMAAVTTSGKVMPSQQTADASVYSFFQGTLSSRQSKALRIRPIFPSEHSDSTRPQQRSSAHKIPHSCRAWRYCFGLTSIVGLRESFERGSLCRSSRNCKGNRIPQRVFCGPPS
jgi:hypothetical protein